MRAKAGLKGRPTKKDQRSLLYQCDKLHLDATVPGDQHILCALYRAIFVEESALTRAILGAAKELACEEVKAKEWGIDKLKAARAAAGAGDE